jgi:iron-sulfur cluster assembly protein
MIDESIIRQTVEEIRPYFQKDGGDLEWINSKKDVVYLRLTGRCRHCSLNNGITRKGIEAILKEKEPALEKVIIE